MAKALAFGFRVNSATATNFVLEYEVATNGAVSGFKSSSNIILANTPAQMLAQIKADIVAEAGKPDIGVTLLTTDVFALIGIA